MFTSINNAEAHFHHWMISDFQTMIYNMVLGSNLTAMLH